jgi:homocysteine S-methyltransferase
VTDLLAPFIARRGAAILDGGLASELEARGGDISGALWSAAALVDRPDAIAAVHRAYLEAGADVIETATYQASIPGFVARGLTASEAAAALVSGARLALRERDAFWEAHADRSRVRPLVAASLGPYGAFLADGSEYRGDYRIGAEALANWHRPRLRVLEASGVDLLAFETIPSLEETRAIARVLEELEGPPAWISFQARDAASLADGAPIEDAVAIADRSSRIVAAGVNCVAPDLVSPLLARFGTATGKPLVAYPNRGGAWNAAARTWGPATSAVSWSELIPGWRVAGASLIGGCCRTTPDDIRAISAAL